jgi:hypothetical protein
MNSSVSANPGGHLSKHSTPWLSAKDLAHEPTHIRRLFLVGSGNVTLSALPNITAVCLAPKAAFNRNLICFDGC